MKTYTEEQKRVAEKLFNWAKARRISINDLSVKFDVKPNALSNWKKRGIPIDKYEIAASLVGIPLEILVSKENELESNTDRVRMLPVINSVHAGSWTGIGDTVYEEYLPCIMPCSKDTFCLRVEGNSMNPVFMTGDVVVVDPSVLPTAGRYVVAIKDDEDVATIKKYRALGLNSQGQEAFELVPMNPDFASYRSDQCRIRIIGVVISYNRSV